MEPYECDALLRQSFLEQFGEDCKMIENTKGMALRNDTVVDEDRNTADQQWIACKESKKRCSLKKTGSSPCVRCRRQEADWQRIERRPDITQITPFFSGPGLYGGGRQIKTIHTYWAHPIEFKHLSSARSPCHFCTDFRYGIFGLGPKEVDVIQYRDGEKFEEMGNGHRSKGCEATRMCVHCSLNRLHISRCKIHIFAPLGTRSKANLDYYAGQVIAPEWVPLLKTATYPTCSLCVHAAFWRRCVSQKFNKLGQKLSPADGKDKGCGLVLCDLCHTRIKEAAARSDSDGIRADADFLFPESLLHIAFSTSFLAMDGGND
ncbi:uncharacterized protein Z518_04347 [Rhinocladiella mackenziei CBS 650.93]|uniref:Zn(2)-C6 fungal-type domain-containing protein n=1 Tax=Rhinocladiella mackenziei CBS 650.93 TaxID=1442369 RepID=A0A0D2IT63_9EURO|nr:uncharacterized protein Z518_04347 [Rhinocladiella mackenziei CBS 650.93]KIX06371.1 hypothetical protein Z518_04347 [Rhinocladiella mackenziei CBS 650.93]